MSPVVQKLASKLEEWEPEVSREVQGLVAEIIEPADLNVLDLARSRRVEQEVLDLLDALDTEEHPGVPTSREPLAALRALSGSAHSGFADISTEKYTHVAAAAMETLDEASDRS
jgi:hypothetical protein